MYPHLEFRQDRVIKHFDDPVSCQKELSVYTLGLPVVPRLLADHSPVSLELELIHGCHFADDPGVFDPVILAKAVACLHGAFRQGDKCLCHWDNNPKNILISEGKVYLIDFADICIEYPEYDLTHLLLFWFGSVAEDTLRQAINAFVSSYRELLPIDAPRWNGAIPESLERFIGRRRQWGRSIPDILRDERSVIELLTLSQ